MFQAVLMFVLACTSAVLAIPDPTPPYVESLQSYRAALKILEDRVMSSPDRDLPIDDLKRQYLVISNVIEKLAASLAGCVVPSYDAIFMEVVQREIPYAFQNYKQVIQTAISLVKTADERIQDLEDLIDAICGEVPSNICDYQLNVIIQQNQQVYGAQAKLLLALGDASDDFNDISDTIDENVAIYNSIGFCIEGRETLRPLVIHLADALRLLNPLHSKC